MRDDRKARPKRVDEALEGYLNRARLKRRLKQASVVPEWAELVGEDIARVTTPHHVTPDGVLIVSVESASWMQELTLMSPEILRKLGAHGKGIRRIVWRAE